jgi:hypothetical protein
MAQLDKAQSQFHTWVARQAKGEKLPAIRREKALRKPLRSTSRSGVGTAGNQRERTAFVSDYSSPACSGSSSNKRME